MYFFMGVKYIININRKMYQQFFLKTIGFIRMVLDDT